MKSKLNQFKTLQDHVLILLQGLFLENIYFDDDVISFFKKSSESLMSQIETYDSSDTKIIKSIDIIQHDDFQFHISIDDLRMTKHNHIILKRAINLQKRINQVSNVCLANDNDHWRMQHICTANKGIYQLMEGKFSFDNSPVWGQLSFVNSTEHIEILKSNDFTNLAIDFLKWRIVCAKKREDHLFGHYKQYEPLLLKLYLDIKNWDKAKAFIDKNLQNANEKNDRSDIAFWTGRLSDYYHHQGDLMNAISILEEMIDPINGISKVSNTTSYQTYIQSLADLYEESGDASMAIQIIKSYNPDMALKWDGFEMMDLLISEKLKNLLAKCKD